ncbi:MAG: DUF4159 domain-containing protein [Candidatus Krumholzibacteriota bacterium]|nr:DUF4159 domain-containing protein [Candidatus Krumholzibacteriota bacterium]
MNSFLKTLIFLILIAAAALCVKGQGYYRPEEDPAAAEPGEEEIDIGRARIGIGRVRYGGGGDWYGDPSSIPNLLKEFSKRTGIRTAKNETVVSLLDQDIFSYPFLYITGHGNIGLQEEELANLRRHLLGGGFLYADDNYGMDESFRSMVSSLFPERDLVAVALDHDIYNCFYHLEGVPKIHEHGGKPPEGLGVFNGDRLMIFYTYESDIGDGLEDADVHGDPPGKREAAVRMAVNILYYALTY